MAEILDAYLADGEPMVLIEYAGRLGNRAVLKRLGFLVESLGLEQPELLDGCLARRSAGVVLLDSSAPAIGPRVPRWGLRANAVLDAAGPR